MLLTALTLISAQAQEPALPQLDAGELTAWRAHLRPSGDDLAYARIDWESTFLDGLQRAAAERKPLLLWLMNGHPLGCT